jgi:flagellar basal body-associated protein FliL
MDKGKIAVLLLAILVLNLSVAACGFTSQGSQEQNRPAENQNPAEEDETEPILEEK